MSISYVSLSGTDADIDCDRAIIRDKLFVADGSQNNPSISFLNNSNTGIFSNGLGQLNISSNGVENIRVEGGQLELTNGSEALPSLTYISDPNTGLFRNSIDTMSITCSGRSAITCNFSRCTIFNTLIAGSGSSSASSPALIFSGSETNTGLFRPSSSVIGFACSGTQVLTMSSSVMNSSMIIRPSANASVDLGSSANMWDWLSPQI